MIIFPNFKCQIFVFSSSITSILSLYAKINLIFLIQIVILLALSQVCKLAHCLICIFKFVFQKSYTTKKCLIMYPLTVYIAIMIGQKGKKSIISQCTLSKLQPIDP